MAAPDPHALPDAATELTADTAALGALTTEVSDQLQAAAQWIIAHNPGASVSFERRSPYIKVTLPVFVPHVASIVITPATASLTSAGATQAYTGTVKDQAGNTIIPGTGGIPFGTYSSSNTGSASIDSATGIATETGNGTTNITFTCQGVTSNVCVLNTSGVSSGGTTGAGPNLPAGMTTWFNYTCDVAPPQSPATSTQTANFQNFGNNTGPSSPSLLSIISDPTAPTSPSNCLRETFPSTLGGGGSPVVWSQENSSAPANTGELYICIVCKLSTGWSNAANTGTKFVQIPNVVGGTTGSNNYFGFNGSGATAQPFFATQFGNNTVFRNYPGNLSNPNMNDGHWHVWEIYQLPESPATGPTVSGGGTSNGVVKMWVDGVAVASYGDAVLYAAPGLTKRVPYLKSDATFGGGTHSPPATQWIDIDNFYAALR